jgi:pimeloyl-ACP methyl ester carboxylesterase
MTSDLLVLPRPGTAQPSEVVQSIAAPSESAFTATFGNLLPPASYLQTPYGRAAYYPLPPSSPPPTAQSTKAISRVLFVHGIQTPALGLQPLASLLSSRFPHAQCVLFDHWGHGLSDTPIAPHEPALFHALMDALLDQLGWEDAHLIGYSFGGSTTASFAASRPKRVSSMVLVAPAGFIREAAFSELEKSYLRGGDGVDEQAAQAWILDFLEGGPLVVPEDWKESVARGEVVAAAVKEWELREHKGHLASVKAIMRDGGALDTQAEFAFAKAAKTGIRNLCILGELDEVVSVQDLTDLGFRDVVVVPRVGHAVVRERVTEVAGLIEDFWKTL